MYDEVECGMCLINMKCTQFFLVVVVVVAAVERETNFAIINFYIFLFIYSNIVEQLRRGLEYESEIQ